MLNTGLGNNVARNVGGSWTHRRRIIYGTLYFCAFCVVYLLLKGGDGQVHEAIASSAFLLAGGVIGSYVFGAVWDDKGLASADKTSSTVPPKTDVLVGGTDNVDDPDKT